MYLTVIGVLKIKTLASEGIFRFCIRLNELITSLKKGKKTKKAPDCSEAFFISSFSEVLQTLL